jgi:SRSO17 transposase
LGTIANGQAGVLLAYASAHGTTLLDRRLYLPREWLEDAAFAERQATCRLPADVTFQTKQDLALAMVQAVISSQALRCRWFLADEASGRDTGLLDAVADLGLWYLVEVPLDPALWPVGATAATTPQALFTTLAGSQWQRERMGTGTKEPRIADAHVQRVQAQRQGTAGPEVWLILRRNPESGEQNAFLSNAPTTLTPARLVAVRGMRWAIAQWFEVARQHLGMGDDEVRSWTGWHHHMTRVILAHFFLVRLQRRLEKSSGATPGAGLRTAQRAAARIAATA